jgi:hypothetical protein
MRILQITLLAGATQIVANQDFPNGGAQIYCSYLVIQNNSAASVRVGDNTVSATRGILLTAVGGSNSAEINPPRGTRLSDWWLFGTAGDIVDILYEVSQ